MSKLFLNENKLLLDIVFFCSAVCTVYNNIILAQLNESIVAYAYREYSDVKKMYVIILYVAAILNNNIAICKYCACLVRTFSWCAEIYAAI